MFIHVISEFVYVLDTSNFEIEIVCRYPQYYAVTKLYIDINQLNNVENFSFSIQ